jgi:endonuclease/exonuclease/phosphatase family metal-dependent hydrolase
MRARVSPSCLLLLTALFLWAGCASVSPPPEPTNTPDAARTAQALLPDYAYPTGDTVRVATYNLEHFVDVYDDPYMDARRENDPDPAVVAEKHRLFAEALRALDADVLSLQEVEGEGIIRALVDSLVPDLGYRFVASADDADWYQNVVVLSRLPLGPLTTFADAVTPIPGQFDDAGRPEATDLINHRLFVVDVYARPDYAFTLAAAHLKAGRSDRDAAWRTGQADLLHAWLGQRFGDDADDANVLIAGDLNATPDGPSFEALLNVSGTRGPVRFEDPLADTDEFSHAADAPARRIDHILVSEGISPEIVPSSARVAMPVEPDPERLSDHLPVVVDLVARDR